MLHETSVTSTTTTSSTMEEGREDNDEDNNSSVLTKEHQMLTALGVKKTIVETLDEKQAKQALNALLFLIENGW
jgi:hypothetical protein